jgi:hypothetical protein
MKQGISVFLGRQVMNQSLLSCLVLHPSVV